MPDKSTHSEPPLSGSEPDILRHAAPPRLKFYGVVAACVAVFVLVAGLAWRFYADARTEVWTDDQAVQTVEVIKLHGARTGGALILPGDVQAFTNAPIYAQVAGTIQKWFVDIGTPVKAGQLLAQIDPRPFQAALDQAKGQLARDNATLANAKVDLGRYESLAAQNAVSNQQLSTQRAQVAAQSGVVATDQAAVENASINLGYTRIVAPFDGIVTSRAVDVGNFVAVGNASATPLFTVTDQNKLRIYVRVPQVSAGAIRPGLTVAFTVPEHPGQTFTATLAASAGAVQSQSGTQLVQFQIDNSDGALKPGDYAEVHIVLPAGARALRLPATALMFRDSGMLVATVGPQDRVQLKPVTISADLGSAVEVGAGLSTGDRVINNPPDSLQAGDKVRVTAD